jgi:hypothetical protein
MRFSGLSPDERLVEIAELADHPFMLGSQFHPEFKSRPNRPHPLFVAFLEAAIAHNRTNGENASGKAIIPVEMESDDGGKNGQVRDREAAPHHSDG